MKRFVGDVSPGSGHGAKRLLTDKKKKANGGAAVIAYLKHHMSIIAAVKRSGTLADRWVNDFLHGILALGSDESFRCPPDATSSGDGPNEHRLVRIESQEGVSSDGNEVKSFICQECRLHFFFEITDAGSGSCAGHDSPNLLHHLRMEESREPTGEGAANKLFPALAAVRYECTAGECSLEFWLRVSAPRLRPKDAEFLMDKSRVRANIEKAIESDTEPDRFRELNENTLISTSQTLNAYLRNALSGDSRRITARNKYFQVQLGNSEQSIELLQYLGFEKEMENEDVFWKPPTLEPEGTNPKTGIMSKRAFLEDFRTEIFFNALRAEEFKFRDDTVPTENGKPHLQTALKTRPQEFLAGPKKNDTAFDLAILGATPTANDELLLFAYDCQLRTDYGNANAYQTALSKLAENRDTDFQLEVVKRASTLEALAEASKAQQRSTGVHDGPINTLDLAYSHFNIPADCRSDADFVLKQYKIRREQAPAQKAAHREYLFQIGESLHNNELLRAAVSNMDIDEACRYIEAEAKELSPEYVSLILPALARTAFEGKNKRIVAEATRVIGENTRNQEVVDLASQFELTCDINDEDPGETSITVKTERKPQVDLSLPAGLANLRNTCYLNSILQYLFTVKPVRDLVLNSEEHMLELTPEAVAARRIGGTQEKISLADAIVAHNVMKEFHDLFIQLGTAQTSFVRPTQRLANGALLSAPNLIKNTSKPAPKVFGPELPPLPPRAPPPIPPRPEPKVTVDQVSDKSETASNVSSQTLVNQIDEDSANQAVEVSAEPTIQDSTVPMEVEQPKLEENAGSTTIAKQSAENDDGKDKSPTPLTSEALDADPDIQEKLLKALNNEEISGTEQEDAEEAMGQIITHLHAAIKATRILPPQKDYPNGFQVDPLIEALYLSLMQTTKNYEKDTKTTETSRTRWVSAYPAPVAKDGKPVSRDLYEALDPTFDQETFPRGVPRGKHTEVYNSLLSTPSIFHVRFQRADTSGRKNDNPISIPRVLYLDRYMHYDEGSPQFKDRRRVWNLKRRIATLDEALDAPPPPEPKPGDAKQILAASARVQNEMLEKYAGISRNEVARLRQELKAMTDENRVTALQLAQGSKTLTGKDQEAAKSAARMMGKQGYSILDENLVRLLQKLKIALPEYAGLDPAVEERKEKINAEWAAKRAKREAKREAEGLSGKMDPQEILEKARLVSEFLKNKPETVAKERAEHVAEIAAKFESDQYKKHKYRLHAAICHGGSRSSAGHYWIWIYDFEQDVWRKYNDTVVEVHPHADGVLEKLSSGEPYYLAYVRDEDKLTVVSVPPRARAAGSSGSKEEEEVEEGYVDVAMTDAPAVFGPALPPRLEVAEDEEEETAATSASLVE